MALMTFKIGKKEFVVPDLRQSFVAMVSLALLLVMAGSAQAQIRRVARRTGGVNLPYTVGDGKGESWVVYQPSTIGMQGNFPVYQQAATLTIAGQQPNMQIAPRLDDKSGELIMENVQIGGFVFTRRILFNTDDGYIRVIDLIKNPTNADQQLNMQLMSYVNFGVQSEQLIPDPKKAAQNIAWVATTAAGNNKAALDVYAGAGSKMVPTLEAPPGNNFVQATINTTVPANKELAFAHFHMVVTGQEQGVQWVSNMKPAKLFADLPKEVRNEIVNFRAHNSLLGDLDVLRGDVMDIVELRTGDKFNGNLLDPSFKLDTFYGTVEIPNDKVVGIVNVGDFRPRQLIVTADGQIFGGHLQKQTIDLELTSGQKTQIPLAQIARVGYRHRNDEKEESADDQLQPPYVLMTSGERVGVTLPPTPMTVVTRYGQLQLSPEVISSIIFNSEESGVHTIELTDGSRFNGLATATEFDVKLNTGGKDQEVKFPIAALNRIVFSSKSDDKDDSAPALQLKKDDLLVGTLQGNLKLDTAFDTIALTAGEIRAITHAKDSPAGLSVTTWDGTVFSGQLEEQSVTCHLKSGVDMQIPIGLVETYSNPSAAVPPMILEKIKQMVTELNADDWKQRDTAEHQLVKVGPGVIATLKQLRDSQPPEAQQRIDSVLKQLQK